MSPEKPPGKKNAHCSYCGARFADEQRWPRTCAGCGAQSFVNPVPVAVVLIPVDGGLVTIRRAIPPHVGELALPGGYINLGESWQEAGAREVYEETGITIEPERIRDHRVLSAPDGTVLIFGITEPLTTVPTLLPNAEVSEVVVLRAPETLAFSLHTQVVADYFTHPG